MKTLAFIIQILCLILVTCGIAISTKVNKIALRAENKKYKQLKNKQDEN